MKNYVVGILGNKIIDEFECALARELEKCCKKVYLIKDMEKLDVALDLLIYCPSENTRWKNVSDYAKRYGTTIFSLNGIKTDLSFEEELKFVFVDVGTCSLEANKILWEIENFVKDTKSYKARITEYQKEYPGGISPLTKLMAEVVYSKQDAENLANSNGSDWENVAVTRKDLQGNVVKSFYGKVYCKFAHNDFDNYSNIYEVLLLDLQKGEHKKVTFKKRPGVSEEGATISWLYGGIVGKLNPGHYTMRELIDRKWVILENISNE